MVWFFVVQMTPTVLVMLKGMAPIAQAQSVERSMVSQRARPSMQ